MQGRGKIELLFLHICELGVSWEPCQLYGSDRAVSLLGDDDFSHVLFLGVVIVVVIAVQKHDDVRILLDRPGLTQVGKHRTVIRTLLDCTGQLRQCYHRHLQLTRDLL